MAKYNTAGLDLSDSKDRKRVMGWCRRNAMLALARIHKDEYKVLLQMEYAAAGITVRPRGMSAEQKRLRKIDKLRRELAALESEAA